MLLKLALLLLFSAPITEARYRAARPANPTTRISITAPAFRAPLPESRRVEAHPVLEALATPTRSIQSERIPEGSEASSGLVRRDFHKRIGLRETSPSTDVSSLSPGIPSLSPQTGLSRVSAASKAPPATRDDASWGANWKRGSFEASDGVRISYRYRPGKGKPVVLLHGRSISGNAFHAWKDAFPGRPLMVLDRRGYGQTPRGKENETNLGERNESDIEQALAVSRKLGDGTPPGVVALSLGAVMLPELSAKTASWLALVNPGAPNILDHLDPATYQAAVWAKSAYPWVRWMPASMRNAWLQTNVSLLAKAGLLSIARAMRGPHKTHAAFLNEEMKDKVSDPDYLRLWIEETLFAASKKARAPRGEVPIFVGLSDKEDTVPPAAQEAMVDSLRDTAESVRVGRWSGDHLTPLVDPSQAISDIESFDKVIK